MNLKDSTLYVIHDKTPTDRLDWLLYVPKIMYYYNGKKYDLKNTAPEWTNRSLKNKPKGTYELFPKIPISIGRQILGIVTNIGESYNEEHNMIDLKDSATSGNSFVHCFLINQMKGSDHFEDIFTVKGQEQRVVIKKLKNGWKIWGSPIGNPESNSGTNVTLDVNTFQRYMKMGEDSLKNKAISETSMKLKSVLKTIKRK